IDPRQIEIQIGNGQKTYDGLVISDDQRDAVEIEWSNLIDDEDLRSYLQLVVRNNGKDADDYTIDGTFAGNSNYVATITAGKFTINKKAVTVTVGNGSKVYDGNGIATWDDNVTIQIPDAVQADLDDLTALVKQNFVAIAESDANAQGYNITFGETTHQNYTITYAGTRKYTITPRPITVSVDNKQSIYGNEFVALTAQLTGGTLVDGHNLLGENAIVSLAKADGTTVDSYAITGQCLNSNYDVTFVAGTYTINPRPITVTIDDATSIYGDQVAELTHSVTSAYGIVSGDTNVYSVTCDVTSASNVGSYDITGVVGSNANYTVTFVNGTYTVTKRDITVTIGNDTKVYDGNAPTLSDTISVTINGAVAADIPALQELVRGGFVAITQVDANADGYTIRSSFAGNNNYNAPTYANGKFVITKRGLTVTLAKANSIYGDDVLTSKQLYALATVQNAVDNNQLFDLAVLNGSNAVDSTNGVGLYDIVVVATSINDNYFIENVVDGTGLYQINPRPITVTINDVANHIYGNNVTSALLSAKITSGNAVNGDILANIVKLETTVDNTTDVGSYPIDAQQLDDNYDVTVVAGKFTVVARPVTIVIENKSSVYGDEFQQATATVLGSSAYKFVNGDNLYDYVTLTNPTQTNVGTYDITGVDKAADDNYAVTVQSGKYTITARPIYIQIGSLSKVYDRQANDLSNVEITVWYVNADGENVDMTNELCGNVTINDVATQVVGSYTLQATFAGNNNYVVAQDGWNFGTLTITARPITVTIDDATSIYGETPAKLSANVTAGQVVTGDTRVYTLSCQVKSTTAVGEYQIVGANDNANYDI
ncbi:MAG: hypothetical protein J6Q55_02710, partial [Clostridia bacterium]|nr:hypothetical protein [Clostridia bacterium]